ncbi:extracellular solute-binding protein, partial [Microbacterium maritypicum]
MEDIAAAFTKENPNVTIDIQVTPYKEYFTKLQTAASGGSAADVFWMNGPNFQLYASNGQLAPLDDGGIDAADYPQGLIDLYTYDG